MAMQPTAALATPRRMTLAAVTRGRVERPVRALVYGPEGVGKSTFAANAPNPIFLCSEDGTAQLDVARFPQPQSWDDVLEAVEELTSGQHNFETLVVDTLDWLEPLCWARVCTRASNPRSKVETITDIPYNKGYDVALDEWRILLAKLERMSAKRSMHVVLLAHSHVKPFKNPEGDDFDRYELKLHHKAAGACREWCDAVLFARYETFVDRDTKTKRVRGVSTGARVLHTERTAAYDAKNRYNLPPTMPLDWGAFADAVRAQRPASPDTLRARIEASLESADEAFAALVRSTVSKAGDDAAQLARIADRVSAKLNIAAQQENGQ